MYVNEIINTQTMSLVEQSFAITYIYHYHNIITLSSATSAQRHINHLIHLLTNRTSAQKNLFF